MKLLKPHPVSLTDRWRECQSRDYDSRRVVANFSDGGSNPPRSTICRRKSRLENPAGFFFLVEKWTLSPIFGI